MPAVLVDDLDAVVFAVADQHPALVVDPDPVGQLVLARLLSARYAPRAQQVALSVELVDAAVAVAVRDEDVAVGGRGDSGGHVVGLAGLLDHEPLVYDASVRRLALGAQGEEELLVAAELLDDVRVPVDQVHAAVLVDVRAVGLVELPAPDLDQVAFPVQHQQLVVAAVEGVDVVVGVHGDTGHLVVLVPFGQLAPAGVEGVFPVSDRVGHVVLLVRCSRIMPVCRGGRVPTPALRAA